MKITDRYASAVRSTNLKSDPKTVMADTDVLGAMGIADRRLSVKGEGMFEAHPLAVPLERLFAGDPNAGTVIVAKLSEIIRDKAPSMRLKITETQAEDMAKACLGWHRDSACKVCGGHGYKIIPGTKTLGDSKCSACKGTGKVHLVGEFHPSQYQMAGWVLAYLEREAGRAGPAAMKALAPSLDL